MFGEKTPGGNRGVTKTVLKTRKRRKRKRRRKKETTWWGGGTKSRKSKTADSSEKKLGGNGGGEGEEAYQTEKAAGQLQGGMNSGGDVKIPKRVAPDKTIIRRPKRTQK